MKKKTDVEITFTFSVGGGEHDFELTNKLYHFMRAAIELNASPTIEVLDATWKRSNHTLVRKSR